MAKTRKSKTKSSSRKSSVKAASRTKPKNPQTKNPARSTSPDALTQADLEARLDKALRKLPLDTYQVSAVARTPSIRELLNLHAPDRCRLVEIIARRLCKISELQHEALSSKDHSSFWKELPTSKLRGIEQDLLLGRLLSKDLPLTDPQLLCVVRAFGSGAITFSAKSVATALSRALQSNHVSAAVISEVEALLPEMRKRGADAVRAASTLTRILNDRIPRRANEPKTQSSTSALEQTLLRRSSLKISPPETLVDRMLDNLRLPAEGDSRSSTHFAPEVFSNPVHLAALKDIHAVLSSAKPGTDDRVETYLKNSGPVTRSLTRRGSDAVALAAAAVAAMSQRPIKYDWDNGRAQRFHNGFEELKVYAWSAMVDLPKATAADLGDMCEAWSRMRTLEFGYTHWSDIAPAVARLAKPLLAGRPDDLLLLRLIRFRERVARTDAANFRAGVQTFDEHLGIGLDVPVDLGEPWSDRMCLDLRAMRAPLRASWTALLDVCREASGSKPSAKWLARAQAALSKIPKAEFAERVACWFGLVGKPRPKLPGAKIEGRDSSVPSERAADLLRGLAWTCGLVDTPPIARALGDLAMSCFKMVPGVGARCIKPGTSTVWSLAQMNGPHALSQLSRVRQLVKFGTAKKTLDAALDRLAAQLNTTTDELHEMAAPDFGLDATGSLREQAGDWTLDLAVLNESARIRILDESGKERKSLPDALKAPHAETLKTLKQTCTDIEKVLPAQKARIERLYHDRRTWPAAVWRQRYLEHPLVGTIARRLIWTASQGSRASEFIWFERSLLDVRGRAVDLPDDASVSLWHPALVQTTSVAAWRTFLEERQVRQPFKQAHREVYLLTDAERRTDTYSNRFAAHIIRQSVLNGLCQQRGWKHSLFVMDSGDSPTLTLSHQGLAARFEVQPIGEDYYGNSGAYSFLQTDRVHFGPIGENAALSLSRVDPLTFSEVMRDVDLFVGVCSIGNDPNWADRGDGEFGNDYWHTYSFGNLTTFGQSRRDLLSRLLPRLNIAPLCTLTDKFLSIRGKLRTYKIHLGSGNILMEPNDQYLCIVPGARDGASASEVFLPFEGDRTLSIILSKAFMLAADDKITDPSITRQIKG